MNERRTPRIRPFAPADEDAVIALWATSGLVKPQNDPHRDIARKLTVQPELFVVAVDDTDGSGDDTPAERIVGTVMAGYDGHRGWMNYLATAPDVRGTGIGRALVTHIERALEARGCPKVNLQVRATNAQVVAFYRRLGYAVDDTIDLGKRLIAD